MALWKLLKGKEPYSGRAWEITLELRPLRVSRREWCPRQREQHVQGPHDKRERAGRERPGC